jgi:hypothetical protein
MEEFINKLQRLCPNVSFVSGEAASWSPQKQQVTFINTESKGAIWTTLHETGHALLGHSTYHSDIDLLNKETAAWQEAHTLALSLGVKIDEDHIQQCLDTYRDWLHKRSTCPHCGNTGLQSSKRLYSCLNCQGCWTITDDRFCRPYRLTKA